MLIDLYPLLSQKGKEKKQEVPLELTKFESKWGDYPVVSSSPVNFHFENIGNKTIKVSAVFSVSLNIPCSRCLEDVLTEINIDTSREVNLSDTDLSDEDTLDQEQYMDGSELDVTKFAYGEILVNLPMKVLCRNDCRGICYRCGKNLNHGSCGCDTTELDPRMAKALQVFNSFKEV